MTLLYFSQGMLYRCDRCGRRYPSTAGNKEGFYGKLAEPCRKGTCEPQTDCEHEVLRAEGTTVTCRDCFQLVSP